MAIHVMELQLIPDQNPLKSKTLCLTHESVTCLTLFNLKCKAANGQLAELHLNSQIGIINRICT